MYYEYSNNCIPYAGYGLSFHTTVVAELEFNTENLSLLQGQQTESTKHYGPLPNGLACRLRNKEDEVHSGSKRNTKHKRARTVVEQYITSVTMPVVGGFAASATADSPPQMQPLTHASF